jgi:hypothetical protein
VGNRQGVYARAAHQSAEGQHSSANRIAGSGTLLSGARRAACGVLPVDGAAPVRADLAGAVRGLDRHRPHGAPAAVGLPVAADRTNFARGTLAAGMATSQQGSALVRVISAAKTVAGGKGSRRKGRRVVAASRVRALGSRKVLLTRQVARQDRLRSVRSSRLLLFAQQMVRHELLRFAYCIAVGGSPTNCAPSLVEQRGALERTAFSACQRLGECLCGSARGCTAPGIGINGRIKREGVVQMFQAMGSHRPRADGRGL